MKELKKEDIKQEVFDLYDDYAHNRIDRRLFMDKLSMYAVGGITVASLLSFISPNYHIIQIAQDDSRLKTETISYDSPREADQSSDSFPDRRMPKENFRASWWYMRTVDLIHTSPTSDEGPRWLVSSRLRPTLLLRSVATPAMMMKAVRCKAKETVMKCWRTLLRHLKH